MNRDILLMFSSTARVKNICEELLSDGKPHTRKEMECYIEEQFKLLDIEKPSQACISGGILQAVKKGNCVKLGTALYQLDLISINDTQRSRIEKATDCLQTSINTLIALTRTIDYVSADDTQIDELNKLKHCINEISKMQNILNS